MAEETVAACGPASPVSEAESREMFGRLQQLVLADIAVARLDAPPSGTPMLQPTLLRALLYMSQRTPDTLAVGDLAEGLNISFGWASRIADELTSVGLIERGRDEGDRRVVHLRLTARARSLGKRILRKREAPIRAALATVPPAQRPAIARFFERLTQEYDRQVALAQAERD